jgi:Ni/Co efflux regulator RcnB
MKKLLTTVVALTLALAPFALAEVTSTGNASGDSIVVQKAKKPKKKRHHHRRKKRNRKANPANEASGGDSAMPTSGDMAPAAVPAEPVAPTESH